MSSARQTSGENPTGESTRLKEVGGFQLIAKIGQGGMGTVFKARQISLDRIVALKILPPSIAKDAKFIDRFQREARASAKLNHPNIVQGIDVGKDAATGLWYFAMELVDGPSLLKVLKEQRVIPEERALLITRDMAQALECAANQGIVHRDIKPDNILLTKSGEAKLADLGLAKQLSDDSSVTQSGQALGTPYYMAPEQVRGQSDIDQRTDIYALGGTLFHLVTGQPPFQGETSPVIMTKHLSEPPPRANKINPEVSEGCTRLIVRMMQKKKEQRVQNAKELIAAIDKIISGEDMPTPARSLRDTTGPRTAVSQRTAPPARQNSNSGMMMALAGVAVVALLAFVLMSGKKQEPEPSRVATNDPPRNERRPEPAPAPIPVQPAPVKAKNGDRKPVTSVDPAATTKKGDGSEPNVVDPDVVIGKGPKTEPAKTDPAAIETEKPVVPTPEKTVVASAEKTPPAPAEKVPPPDGEKTPVPVPTPETANAAAKPARDWKGFKAEYFEGPNFETSKNEQVDPAIDFTWPKGAPAEMKPAAGVSVRWNGFIEAPESGEYTFEISAQAGARLYVDEMLLWDSWGGRPASGRSYSVTLDKTKKYAIQFEMHQKSTENAATATLKWGQGANPTTLVYADPPDTAAQGLPVGHVVGGWKAEYGKFDSETPAVTRMEPAINWDWHSGSPALEIPNDKFWARWTGLIVPPETDEYVFHVDADEGARLYIEDMELLDFMNLGPQKVDSPPLKLEKGKRYQMKLEYVERSEYANCTLKWSSKTMKDALVRAMPPGDGDGVLPPDGFLAEYGALASAKTLLTRRELVAGGNWKSGSPSNEIPNDKFWARYTGWITPPADGEYIFNLDFDEGVLFYLDDVLLYDSGNRGTEAKADLPGVTLKGGKHYFVRAEYREWSEYAHFFMSWHSAAMAKRPLTALIPDAIKPDAKDVGHIDCGVLAEYGSTGKTPLLKRLEGRIFHDFHSGNPGPEITGANYWGKWSGGFRVPAPGSYAFKIEADLNADVKLNGVSVVKCPPPVPKTTGKDAPAKPVQLAESAPLNLNKGQTYFLEVSFNNHRGEYSYIKLSWKPPGKAEFEEIPADMFLLPPQAREQAKRLK